jgi:ribonuclease P protein component
MEGLKKKEIEETFTEGRSFKFPFFVAIFKENQANKLKTSFIASKKFSKRAVDRNRAKRIMREALRKILKENLNYQNLNYNLILIARPLIKKKKALI